MLNSEPEVHVVSAMVMPMFDAHVHMGYFARKGFRAPHYYSPRRINGVLRRCGVDEFVVSSTCAQVSEIPVRDLNREAREMKRLAGARAHVFLWVSGRVLAEDPQLMVLDEMVRRPHRGRPTVMGKLQSGRLYEGIKLHEMETPWVRERQGDLARILAIADDRGLPVQFHSAAVGECRPAVLARWAEKFPNVRFDFAHCPNMSEMVKIMADCPNVWTDTAYWPIGWFEDAVARDWKDRLLFGTDLPVWQAHEDVGMTARYREYVNACHRAGLRETMQRAFESFVRGR